MNQDPTNTTEQEEPREGIAHPGQRRRGSIATFETSTGARDEPQIVVTHQRPQHKPLHLRVPAEAQARLEAAQSAQARAKQEIEEIEDHFKSRQLDLDELKRNIRIKIKEAEVFRRGLANLEPSALAQRWEAAYWAHVNDPFDLHTTNQWLLAASLKSNSPALADMLNKKLKESERALAAMEKERAALEKELGAETASIE